MLANRIANGLDPADVGTGTFHNPSQNSLSHLSPFQQQLLSPRQQKNSFSPVRQSILDNIVSNVTVYVTKALANQGPDKNHIASQSTSAAQSGISSATKNTFV